jgi:glycosyltransferase involved in cell wall biosynthesis
MHQLAERAVQEGRATVGRRAPAAPFLRETTVLIPARNEAECIGSTVADWLELGAARVRVVDNGSSDATARLAVEAGAEVVHECQTGYGAAAWLGLQSWPDDTPWVLFSSADGSDRLSAAEAVAWQKALDQGAALLVGDRTASPESRRHLKPAQRFGNWLTCRVLALGWGRRFSDMGSLRLTRRDSLVQLGLVDRAFGWNVEMQVRAIERSWKIVELPVQYYPRGAGESKISGSFLGTIRAGLGIIRMQAWLWQLRQPGRSRTRPRPESSLPKIRSALAVRVPRAGAIESPGGPGERG